MKQILYGGGSFLTCDHIASELLEYGVELAEQGLASSVDIPVLLPDGTPGTATVLLGPASQFVVMPDDHDGELDCEDAIAAIGEHRRELATAQRARPWDDGIGSSMIDPI
ncbi:MAG TPA: hypothetical protein VGM70_10055 [Pseudolysinimonas sp.]|jgi:hypothetical protein